MLTTLSLICLTALAIPTAPITGPGATIAFAASTALFTPDYAGTFVGTLEGNRLVMVIQRDGQGFKGTVTIGGTDSTNFTAAATAKGLEGQGTKQGDTFLGTLDGDRLTIDAGGSKINLTRQSGLTAPTPPVAPAAGTDPFVGTFTGKEGDQSPVMTLREGAGGYAGTVNVGSEQFNVIAKREPDGSLSGTFNRPEGGRGKPFLARIEGNTLSITDPTVSGRPAMALTRTTGAPPIATGPDPFSGTFTGKEVEEALVLTLREEGDRYVGTITVGSQVIPLTATRQPDGSLAGNLTKRGQEGKGDPFIVKADGDTLILSDPKTDGKRPLEFIRAKAASSGSLRQVLRDKRIAFVYPNDYTITKADSAKVLFFKPVDHSKQAFAMSFANRKAAEVLGAMHQGKQPDPIIEAMFAECNVPITGAASGQPTRLGSGEDNAAIMRIAGPDGTAAVVLVKVVALADENNNHDLVFLTACGPKDQLEAFLPTLRRIMETAKDRPDADTEIFIQQAGQGAFDVVSPVK